MVLRKSFLTAIPVSYFCNGLPAGISLQTLSHFSVHEKTCQRSPPVLQCPVISDSSKPLFRQTFHKSCIFLESLSGLFPRPDFVQNMPGILFLSSQVLPVHSHSSPFNLFIISLTAFFNYLTCDFLMPFQALYLSAQLLLHALTIPFYVRSTDMA